MLSGGSSHNGEPKKKPQDVTISETFTIGKTFTLDAESQLGLQPDACTCISHEQLSDHAAQHIKTTTDATTTPGSVNPDYNQGAPPLMRGSPPDIVDDAANRLYHRKPIHRAIVEGSRIELHSKNSIPNFSSRVAADSRELSSISYSALW